MLASSSTLPDPMTPLAQAFRSPLPLCTALAALTICAAWLALGTGPVPVTQAEIARSLGSLLGLGDPDRTPSYVVAVVTDIRLPRVILAVLVGAALAQAGAAMQGIFRNPLAEPAIVGVSGGAAVAAVAMIVAGESLGISRVLPQRFTLPVAAFLGGAAATVLVLRLARVDGTTRAATLLLAGLALNAIAGAAIGFFSHIASDVALRSVMFWMFGSLGKSGWREIAVGAPLLLAAIVLIPRDARALNALLLGEAEAGHLGVNVERLKRRLAFLVVLAAGVSVALAGLIGFVGLIVPHLVRLWAGPDHRVLLPASALLGALLLLVADMGARTVLAPTELPVGVLTALVGGPFFLALLLRYRGEAGLG